MAISYHSAVQQLLALGHELATNRKFDLEHMRVLVNALGHPERRFQSVLIAGTNGKGSTAATLASIVRTAGYRTGLYTSPHLMRVNERIQVNGEQISDVEFAVIYERVNAVAEDLVQRGALPWHPSFFEMLTAMAFEYFASAGVELAVLEVGMGGRLDATNVVEPCLSVITDIDLDHQKFLGDTLPEIAHEKAGILRANTTVVLLPQHPVVNETLGREIMDHGAKAVSAVKNMPSLAPAHDRGTDLIHAEAGADFRISVFGEEILIASPLRGRHQLRNLALAITAAEELNNLGFKISATHIKTGVRSTLWPGRFQVIPAFSGHAEVVLDVAHNPAGAWALRSALSTFYEDRKLTFIFGAMRDKAIAEIASILFPLAERVIVTQAGNPRAASAHEIAQLAQPTQSEMIEERNVESALARANQLAADNGVVVITGSIYIVGEAMGLLMQRADAQKKVIRESVHGV